MIIFPKKIKKGKTKPKIKMKPLNMKKVAKKKKEEEFGRFRNTTLKVCNFHLTWREKYEKEKLDAKRKMELMGEEAVR